MDPSEIRAADLLALQRAVLERIASRSPRREVLEELCRLVELLVGDSVCSVMLYHPATNRLELLAAPSAPEELRQRLDGLPATSDSGNCGVAVLRREAVIVADTATDPLWREHRALAAESGIRSCWSVPFFSSRGEVLGSLGISRRILGTAGPEQLELLRTAGALAGIAIDYVEEHRRFVEQEALLSGIVRCSEDPIFAKDLGGRYLIANAAETQGRLERPDLAVGLTDAELFPDQLPVCRRTDEEVLRTEKSLHYEHEIEHPLLGLRTYLVKKSPLRDREGGVRGVLGISRDVTDLRQAEEALRRAQKLEWLGVLTGGIAHDFNNLLTGILGNAELLLARLPEGSPESCNALEIRRASVRAAELIRQMQAYAGKGERVREVLSLPEITNEIVGLLTRSIGKDARLCFQVEEGLPPVEVDGTQIRQVVMNLVTNASDALEGAAGTIEVAMRSLSRGELPRTLASQIDPGVERLVALRVTDTGKGMDEATQARIFDPFFSTKFEGRGLGLAATLGIVRRHGGAIEVVSRPGAGARFSVYLPAARTPIEILPARPAKHPEWRGRGRVLVVDDEPQVLHLARSILERAGFESHAAASGHAAITKVAEFPGHFDLVVLDHTMPGLSALQVLARLRELQPGLAVVLSSGHPAEFVRAAHAGAPAWAGFLEKPYGPAEMLAAVRKALEPSRPGAALGTEAS